MCAFSVWLVAQSADVTEGCIPLIVNFQGPQLQEWLWDFGDNTSSSDQNPNHTYTNAGEYTVSLREGPNGAQIGTLTISVFPEITLDLISDVNIGCIPLDVQFNTNITQANGITIDSLEWTFGDGAELQGNDLMHTYNLARVFDLSIEAFTTPANCRNIFRFEDFIEAEDLTATISPVGEVPCTEPSTFSYQIDKPQDPRYTYEWDFGNGMTSTSYDAGDVTYDRFGIYMVTLTISSPSGCIVTNELSIQIGPPAIDIIAPDSLCIGQEFTAFTNTLANRYEWTWGDTLKKSLQTEITSAFYTPGLKPILLEAFLDENCKSDTTINIFIEIPDSDFTIEPAIFCSDTTDKILTANVGTHNTYLWNDSIVATSTLNLEGLETERDSFYIPVSDTLVTTLEVTSQIGCTSKTENIFVSRLPEAYFIPNITWGFLSANVTFSDFSQSEGRIVRRSWDYGDGTSMTFLDSTVVHSYQYDTCGVFPVNLEIEDDNGCIQSAIIRYITIVGCTDTITSNDTLPDFERDSLTVFNTGNTICVNDSLLVPTSSPNPIDRNVYMNGERLNYCWRDLSYLHIFNEPGEFEMTFSLDLFDIELRSGPLRTYEVEGASAHLDYEISCDDPQLVQLSSQSNNATELEWIYNGEVISTAENLEFEILEPGVHTILLAAQNTPSGCPADTTSTTVYIQKPVADFTIPDVVCDSVPILLDATASANVFGSCHQGYRWEFEHQRPRVTDEPILEHRFAPGEQEVTLIVQDINGCSDTTTNRITAYGVDPNFIIDSLVCLPYSKEIQNVTTSDTTIVAWDWSFGSNDFMPTYTFDESDISPDKMDSIEVSLRVEDAFGCRDTLTKIVRTFEPRFGLDFVGSRILCEGDDRKFFVFDSIDVSHLFNFQWDFYGVEIVDSSETRHTFEVEGNLPVTLTYEQIGGGCNETLDTTIIVFPAPEVCFMSDIDTLDFICAPAQVAFMPCTIDEDLSYEWQLGADDASILASPVNDFGVGIHEIQLIVTDNRRCTDTLTQFITLSGSSGEIVSDQDVICLDETVTFDLQDTMNIGRIIWDFGDGTTLENQSPVTHIYETDLQDDFTFVKLILESTDGNCTTIDSIPIELSSVEANFINLDSLNICDGRIRLQNNSVGANQFEWLLDDGTVLTTENPILTGDPGTQTIQLIASNDVTGCTDIQVRDLSIPEQIDTDLLFPNLFSPNGDGNNDFFAPAIPADLEGEIEIGVFRIYNRWGQLVYDNTNRAGWNGTFNSTNAPPEVYAYYIELIIEGCDGVQKKGNVTLIR